MALKFFHPGWALSKVRYVRTILIPAAQWGVTNSLSTTPEIRFKSFIWGSISMNSEKFDCNNSPGFSRYRFRLVRCKSQPYLQLYCAVRGKLNGYRHRKTRLVFSKDRLFMIAKPSILAWTSSYSTNSSFSIVSFETDHFSCNSLFNDNWKFSLGHHSPQLVKKIWSISFGKSSRVKAARIAWAPKKSY